MEAEENSKEPVVKRPKRKIWKIVIGILAVIILILAVAVVFAVPAYVSSESCRQMILSKANAGGEGVVDFTDLKMSWGDGIKVSGISYKDKQESMSVAVKGFSTRPRYGALLTGNVSLGETVIDEPKIEIDVARMKKKTEEGKTRAGSPRHEQKTEAQAGLPIGRIDLLVKNGDVKIKGGGGAVEVSQINSSVNLRPEGEKSNFEVKANVAGGGPGAAPSTINAKGEVKPGKGWNFKKTSGDVTVEVNNLNLSSLETILAIAGVDVEAKGVVSGNLKGAIKDGMIDNAAGNVKATGLEISAAALKGDRIKTNTLDLAVSAARAGDLMNVEKLSVATDWLKADANGTAPMSMETLSDFLKPDSKYELRANLECDIPAITAQLPKTLGLKEGMRLTRGKLTGGVQTLTEAGVKKLSGQVSVEGLSGTFDNKPVSIQEPIQAQALIMTEGKLIKFEKAGLTSTFANMTCSGTVEGFSYDAQTDLVKLTSEIGQFVDISKYKLAGLLTSKGKIINNENTVMIVSQSRIENLSASPTADVTITEPGATIDITAAIDKKTDVLLVKQFSAGTSLGQFSVKDGRVPTGKESKEAMELTASARGVDLGKVQPYLVMSKAISKDVQLGGIAESDVMISYKEGTYKLKTETTKITNLLVKAPGKEPFTQSPVEVSLDAEVNPAAKTLQVHKMELSSPNIKIKGTLKQKDEGNTKNLEGNASLDYDWKALSGMLSAFLPAGLAVEGQRKDTISFSSRYPADQNGAMLANLNAQAKLGFEKASYMGLNFGATNVDIKVDKGFLTLVPFTTTVNNGQINFGGTADLKKKPAMFKTPGSMRIVKDIQLNVEITNKLLARINPIFSGTSSITGLANFDCNSLAMPISGGRQEDIEIAGTVSLTNVKMSPTGLMGAILAASGASAGDLMMVHPTPFTVKDGFVRYTNMQMDVGPLPFNFGGSVPLNPDREIEDLRITLPVSATGKIVKVGSETGARRMSAYIKGPPKNARLDLGKTVQEELLQTGLELLLEKQKKK